jgi:hypothetical protein
MDRELNGQGNGESDRSEECYVLFGDEKRGPTVATGAILSFTHSPAFGKTQLTQFL